MYSTEENPNAAKCSVGISWDHKYDPRDEKLREESNRYQLEGVPIKWQQMK